jgi:dTDP-4-dehydrorhamnose reductase
MKIIVFGANGMLGRYVSTYFKRKGLDVLELTREEIDLSDYNAYPGISNYITPGSIVINCAGTIKPIANKQSKEKTFMVNSIWPNYLAKFCKLHSVQCIHITTDCVYTGSLGSYVETSFSDMLDDYGLSKDIGDYCSRNCTVIRTSIIGEELHSSRSLIEWAKSQKNQTVNGYTDHYWNGVTCLELAKVIEKALDAPLPIGIMHIHSIDSVTKFQLLQLISDAFKLDLNILPVESGIPCNRTLKSNLETANQFLPATPLAKQIKDLVNFYEQ